MNSDILAGNWKRYKGNIVEKWAKLTEDDLDIVNGRREQLVGKIQQRYGLTKEQVERQILDFEQRFKL